MRRPSIVYALGASLALACSTTPERIVAPELTTGAPGASSQQAEVTGSGHYLDAGLDVWRTWSFHARIMPDGSVDGTYQLRGHRGHLHGGAKHHGRIVCLVVEGNQAWFAGVDERNAGNVEMVIGFRVIDNGEGAGAGPDGLARRLDISSAEDYCAERPDDVTIPIEAGNIQVRGG